MISVAKIIDSENTQERENGDTYIAGQEEPEDYEVFQKSAGLDSFKTFYIDTLSRKFYQSEVHEKQVGWWCGKVTEIFEDHFTAVLEDLQGRVSVAEFDITELEPSEINLLIPGARFTFSVTQVDKKTGREYKHKIALSGAPIWRKYDAERVEEVTEEIFPDELLDS